MGEEASGSGNSGSGKGVSSELGLPRGESGGLVRGLVRGEEASPGGSVERTQKWHPSRVEIDTMAQWAVFEGMAPESIAQRMGKTVEQVKYQLSKPATQEAISRFREDAMEKAGFAMAQLQIALPDSVNNLIALTRNNAHAKHFDALKFHLELALGPRIKQPQQEVNVTLNVTQQAATLVSEQLPKLAAERGEQRVEHPTNNNHLHFGEEVAESNKASLS